MPDENRRNKKEHSNDGVMWAVFIIVVTAIVFFVAMTVLQEKTPEVFSADSSGITAASKNITAEDVSVMIIPAN